MLQPGSGKPDPGRSSIETTEGRNLSSSFTAGGTVGALGGGAGAAHLANQLGAGDASLVLSSILGIGAGGLTGVMLGSSVANGVVSADNTEGDPKAEAQASYANTGSSPAGYTADHDDEFSDEDLDKYASAGKRMEIPELGLVFNNLKPRTSPEETKRLLTHHEKMAAMQPQKTPQMPPNQLARRPVTNTLPRPRLHARLPGSASPSCCRESQPHGYPWNVMCLGGEQETNE